MALSDDIKAALTIPALAEKLGVVVKVGMIKCIFPGHPDKTPSLSIRENRFQCFGCGEKGSVIDFYMAICGCDQKRAIGDLAAMLGLRGESEGYGYLAQPKASGGVTYVKQRTLQSDGSTVPDEYASWAAKKGISMETVKRIIAEGSLRFDGRVPVYQYNTGDKHRFDINSSSSSRWITGSPQGGLWRLSLTKSWSKKTLALCEGESDTMLASQTFANMGLAGCDAVGLPNANQILTPELATLLGSGRRVIILLDSDKAGKRGKDQAREALATHCMSGEILSPILPDDADLCELGETFLTKLFDELLLG